MTSRIEVQDVCERRQAMLASIPVGVTVIDAHRRLVEANPMAHIVLGLTDDPRPLDALRGHVADPITQELIADADLPWQAALRGTPVHERDVVIVPRDASRAARLVTMSSRPFPDRSADGQSGGAIIVAFDRAAILLRQSSVSDVAPKV